MKELREVSLVDQIEVTPVVTTDRRWLCGRENVPESVEEYYLMFPESKSDPRRNSYGSVTAPVPPFSRGGGLIPVLLKMDNGQLACLTRTGAPHVGTGSEISISFSTDRGASWSDYRLIARGEADDQLDYRDHSLGQAHDGALVVVYGILFGEAEKSRQDDSDPRASREEHLEVVRSTDGGASWSKPSLIDMPGPGIFVRPHGQMVRLPDGTLVFMARGHQSDEIHEANPSAHERVNYLYRSSDGGFTWEKPTEIRSGWSETGFLPLTEDRWVAFVRHNHQANQIAYSNDGGKTWPRWEPGALSEGTPPVHLSHLPDPSRRAPGDARIGHWRMVNGKPQKPSPGSIVRLPNGIVLITYGYRSYPFGVRAIVSRDGGDHFDLQTEYVISDSAFSWDCGYPSTVCYDDGLVVTTAYSLLELGHEDWGTCCLSYRYSQDLFVK